MASNQQNLTHDEVWDDSALVDSWNDALDEYKKYHSIYRHGGNVDDLLKESEKCNGDEAAPTAQPSATSTSRPEGIPAPLLGSGKWPSRYFASSTYARQRTAQMVGPPDSQSANTALVQDEGLKKLMMSWYYAGYYTGLYEGQKQQSQQQ
ncbi:SMN family protein Smn1 [Apiospora aurea]|uniref:SMN family protein Smn1 n=1 Tax=Apiospora aurea TaxID=335848 RepID=A0ABR1Q6Q9_9PEZI